jgi:hypothetical protein
MFTGENLGAFGNDRFCQLLPFSNVRSLSFAPGAEKSSEKIKFDARKPVSRRSWSGLGPWPCPHPPTPAPKSPWLLLRAGASMPPAAVTTATPLHAHDLVLVSSVLVPLLSSLRWNRVSFAGSVLARDFWCLLPLGGQVGQFSLGFSHNRWHIFIGIFTLFAVGCACTLQQPQMHTWSWYQNCRHRMGLGHSRGLLTLIRGDVVLCTQG